MRYIPPHERESALERFGFYFGGGMLVAAISAQVYFVGWLLSLP